jgi:toxin CcdB
MAQFDVRWLNTRRGRRVIVVELQSEFLDHLQTRVVAPVETLPVLSSVGRLNPILRVGSERYVLVTQEMVSVRESDMGPAIGNVGGQRDEIVAAIDLLVTGI